MNRKEIEAVPFKEKTPPEGFTYLAAVSVKKLTEKVLLVDIYGKKPVCRIAVTKSDITTYLCKDKKWRNGQITPYARYGTIWNSNKSSSVVERETFISDADKEKIKSFVKADSYTWLRSLQIHHERVREKQGELREKKWKDKIENYLKSTPPHTPAFLDWAKKQLPENYLYYLRKGNYAYVTCSRCGSRDKYFTGNVIAFEQQFVKKIEIPRRGEVATCKFCGAVGNYQCEGRIKASYTRQCYVYDVQKCPDSVCISLMNVQKTYRIGFEEEYEITEKAKYWYLPGRKTPEAIYNHSSTRVNWTSNKTDWGSKIDSGDYPWYPGAVIELMGTHLQYSGFSAYRKDLVKYMNAYIKNPEIEMLSKMHFTKIVDAMLGNSTIRLNMEGKKLADKLEIWPERVKMLQKCKGSNEKWELYKLERKVGVRIPLELEKEILKRVPTYNFFRLEGILRHISLKKFENYIEKIGWNTLNTYHDYLSMRQELGYDMTDSIGLFPKDLRAQHDRLVLEKNKEDREKRMKEKNEKYPGITRNYKKLKEIYGYEVGDLFIRPAASAGELIEESAVLKHCVGTSDTYMSRHEENSAYILFVRRKSEPELPYCTVEMKPDGQIVQWQQLQNKKPDKEILEPYLQQYTEHIKERIKNE